MIAWQNSTGFFSRKEETITQLAARLFSDYQEKRPRRDDLNTKIQKIKLDTSMYIQKILVSRSGLERAQIVKI